MRRWLRCLVCLLVICSLLINLSPLRVKATGAAAGVAVGVGIGIAVAVGMQALGVRQGSDFTAFGEIVNSCADALSPSWAVDGLVTFLSLTQNGIGKTYASQNFLQAILDWLWSTGVLSSFSNNGQTLTLDGVQYAFTGTAPFVAVRWDCDDFGFYGFISASACTVSYGNNSVTLRPGQTYAPLSWDYYNGYYVAVYNGASIKGGDYTGFTYLGDLTSYMESIGYANGHCTRIVCTEYIPGLLGAPATSSDLVLESVGTDIETDYQTYVDTGVEYDFGGSDDPGTGNESDEGGSSPGLIPYVPIRIPSLDPDSYTDQTQQEAQTGDTPQDIMDQLGQLDGGSGDGSGSDTGTDSGGSSSGNTGSTWAPPSDHNQFALADLSKFFPFCIPFDLFDFFTLLDADPVAPVLSWEIQDLSGQTYALSVDLSEWDSVAQLFRRLQLFLFICGLAAASRKYIKW